MVQRIDRFSVGQSAKVVGVLYALMGLVFVPFVVLASLFSPKQAGFGVGFVLILPILYGVAGFVFTAIGCALYNLVAGWVGGVEVEMGPSSPA